MKTLPVLFLLFALLALVTGGCQPQPPAKAQAEFDLSLTLKTDMREGRMVYVGSGGEIDGIINPDLKAKPGETILLTLVNGDNMPHDLAIPELAIKTVTVVAQGDHTEITFKAEAAGVFEYFCTIPGHRQAGMVGKLIVATP